MPSEKERSEQAQVVADRIHSVAIHLLRRLRREDESSGLNAPRLSALSVIVFGGPITLGELARAEQVRPPTMTRIVDALERLELVTRTKDGADARRTYLAATPAGRTLLMEGRERRVRALARQIGELDGPERDTLDEAAEILKKVLQKI